MGTCSECQFWKPTSASGEELGQCRRNAPRPVSGVGTYDKDDNIISGWVAHVQKDENVHNIEVDVHWPEMDKNAWCGEWRDRKRWGEKPTDASVDAVADAVEGRLADGPMLAELIGEFFRDARPCPECKEDGRYQFTKFPVCERCQNMASPHKAELPHWDENGRPVN